MEQLISKKVYLIRNLKKYNFYLENGRDIIRYFNKHIDEAINKK